MLQLKGHKALKSGYARIVKMTTYFSHSPKCDVISGMRSIISCGQCLNISAHFVSVINK